jgi:hypothetical protein
MVIGPIYLRAVRTSTQQVNNNPLQLSPRPGILHLESRPSALPYYAGVSRLSSATAARPIGIGPCPAKVGERNPHIAATQEGQKCCPRHAIASAFPSFRTALGFPLAL